MVHRGFFLFAVLGLLAGHPLSAQSVPIDEQATLMPGDLLRIGIWREADLSGEFPVDEQGYVNLPMLGRKLVTDVPVGQLVGELTDDYRTQIRNPSITIVPLRQIFVLGDVARPGLYTVPPSTTLAAAVALAGGANPIGDLSKITVYREGELLHRNIPMEQAIAVSDIRSADQIYIGRISWVRRNATYLVGVGFTLYGIFMQFVR